MGRVEDTKSYDERCVRVLDFWRGDGGEIKSFLQSDQRPVASQERVFIFPGFVVVATKDGAVLVLQPKMVEALRAFDPQRCDRVAVPFADGDLVAASEDHAVGTGQVFGSSTPSQGKLRAVLDRLVEASLRLFPKEPGGGK